MKEVVISIVDALKESPLSINEVAEITEINWRTAENYLEILERLSLVFEKRKGRKRLFFLRDEKNYFLLPVKKEHEKLIETIYHNIKKSCNIQYKHDPTKTQAHKIIWRINKKHNLQLPIGWYMYGPCCVKDYRNDEKNIVHLNKEVFNTIKEATNGYGDIEPFQIQRKIYEEENKELYLAKERLLQEKYNNKMELDNLFFDMIKAVPDSCVETTTDYARATLLLGWKNTQHLFNDLWRFITMSVFKESLQEYYDFLDYYFDHKIDYAEKQIQLKQTALVRQSPDVKHR